MAIVDPAKLPYPWPDRVDPTSTIGPIHALKSVPLPGALSASKTSVNRSAWDTPREGMLAFYQDRFVIFFVEGGQLSVNYEAVANFKLKRLLRFPDVRKLTLLGKDGSKMILHIGQEAAANANYILTEKEVPAGR